MTPTDIRSLCYESLKRGLHIDRLTQITIVGMNLDAKNMNPDLIKFINQLKNDHQVFVLNTPNCKPVAYFTSYEAGLEMIKKRPLLPEYEKYKPF